MKEIKDFDSIKDASPVGESLEVPVGAQVCRIIEVEDLVDKEYLEIKFDISQGELTGIFGDSYKQYGEWPNVGIIRRSYKDSALSFFKAFITAVRKSNERFVWNFEEQALKNQIIVVVFGQEEYDPKGKNNPDDYILTVKPVDVRSIDALRENKIKIPPIKRLKNPTSQSPQTTGSSVGSSASPQKSAFENGSQKTYEASQPINVNDDDFPF